MTELSDRPALRHFEKGPRAEQAALAIGAAINETAIGKRVQDIFLRGVGYGWMRAVLSRHLLIEGLDAFKALNPDRGVLLVSNHRSFFDLYVVSVALLAGGTRWIRRLQFPVRGDFFYERPLGIFTNLVAGAGVMYPPFFRERARMHLNRASLAIVGETLRQPGAIVGFHPEGTRNKGADPYVLLPMQPGVGEIALRANPVVVPVFINGLGNSLADELRRRFTRGAARDPCICVLGPPLDLADMQAASFGPTAYKRAANRIGEAILSLSREERALRAAAAAGQLPADDPRWLKNQPASRLYATRS